MESGGAEGDKQMTGPQVPEAEMAEAQIPDSDEVVPDDEMMM